MAERPAIDEALGQNCSWLRCLRCYKSSNRDRNMMLLSCSHTWCSPCFKGIRRSSTGKFTCPRCQKETQCIPVDSPKVPPNVQNLLQPCKFDEQCATRIYQHRQQNLTIAKLMFDIQKGRQMIRPIIENNQNLHKEIARIEQANANARSHLFQGFIDEEVDKILSMTTEQWDNIDIGRVIHGRNVSALTSRRESPSSSLHKLSSPTN